MELIRENMHRLAQQDSVAGSVPARNVVLCPLLHFELLGLILDFLLNISQHLRRQANASRLKALRVHLRCGVAHVGLESEAVQVWDVKERHLVNVELKAALARECSEWSGAQPLSLLNLKLTLVAFLQQILTLAKGHSMRVLEFTLLRQLEAEQTQALPESRKSKELRLEHGLRCKLSLNEHVFYYLITTRQKLIKPCHSFD